MTKQKTAKAGIYVIGAEKEVVNRLRPHVIYLDSKRRGHLRDGRPVKKVGDRWFYIAK